MDKETQINRHGQKDTDNETYRYKYTDIDTGKKTQIKKHR